MILLEDLINLFRKKTTKKWRVRLGNGKLDLLNNYLERTGKKMSDIMVLFNHINKDRDSYLTRFYKTSLAHSTPIPKMHNPSPKLEIHNNIKIKYKNVIRNMFFWEILKNTKSGIENIPTFLDVLEDLYLNNIIDYKLLTPSSLHYIKEGHIASVFSSFYFRASIMNPFIVYSLNCSIFSGKRIFTPTMGWGSYFYGFAESGIEKYVGIDVIPSVCSKMQIFAKENYPEIDFNMICSPSETLIGNHVFCRKYARDFDTVFFSPPYFKMELYEGEEQSTTNYPTIELWLKEYWTKTVKICKHVLSSGGKMGYVLSAYGSTKTKNGIINLPQMMNSITENEGCKYIETIPFRYNHAKMTTHDTTTEQIFIYKKK